MSKTSSEVKNRYNQKVYKMVQVQLKKDLVAAWEAKLAVDGLSKAEFIRTAIQRYLGEEAPSE